MQSMQSAYVSHALSRLNRGLSFCCWLVGLSLVTQLLVWGAAAFMDVRHKELKADAPAAQIVVGVESKSLAEVPAGGPLAPGVKDHEPEFDAAKTADANRVPSGADRMMEFAATTARSTGVIAMILLLPLLLLGVTLSAGSATPGVEFTVSSFMWSLALALLVLPVGEIVGLPWKQGALSTYAYMTGEVEREVGEGGWGSIAFHCRFALLPLAGVVGITMVGMRFGWGVRAGIIPKEDHRLDPVLEREAGNMKATSLHGARAGAALRAAGAAMSEKKPIPAINQVTAGEAPKRLI